MKFCFSGVKGVLVLIQRMTRIEEKTGQIVHMKDRAFPDTLNDEGYLVPIRKRGSKNFMDIPFPDEMTDTEVGKLTRLSKLMILTSNMLGYRARGGIKAYTEAEIIAHVNLSQKRGKEFIGKMLSLHAMATQVRKVGKIEIKEFYINPAYFFAGGRINVNLYLIFREHLDGILPAWVRAQFWQMATEKKD